MMENDEFNKSQWIKGATLIDVPSAPVPDWYQKSPDITSTSVLWQRWGPGWVREVSANGEEPPEAARRDRRCRPTCARPTTPRRLPRI
jgi:hypothetical protein